MSGLPNDIQKELDYLLLRSREKDLLEIESVKPNYWKALINKECELRAKQDVEVNWLCL